MVVFKDVRDWIYQQVVPLVARVSGIPSHTIFRLDKIPSHAAARALVIAVMSSCIRCRNLGPGIREYHIEESGQPALPKMPFKPMSNVCGWCQISTSDIGAIMRMKPSSVRTLRSNYARKQSLTVVTIPDLQKIPLPYVPTDSRI